jgi:nitrite reductase (NADH) large subunit
MLAPQSKSDPVIVVGAGSAGLRLAKDLTKHAPWRPVHSFNGEPSEPYNRVLLTPLVAGEIDTGDVYQTPCAAEQFHQHLNNQIRSIDRGAGLVVDDFGMHHRYSYLVLATGSQPIVPNIPGVDLPEVFTFRTLADAARLVARVAQGDRFVVIGGGLLGIEAARGLSRGGGSVVLVEHETRIMSRQLDDTASRMLAGKLDAGGVTVILRERVMEICGDGAVRGVKLGSGREIPCEVVVLCIGIRPETALARIAGLDVGRGIRVDDQLRSSDPRIFAIGECAEHRGRVYGLAPPCIEQAEIAAKVIADCGGAYHGSVSDTKLKAARLPVFCIGAAAMPGDTQLKFLDESSSLYRKLVTRHGRLTGAIVMGKWHDAGRLQAAVHRRSFLWPWQRLRFQRTGEIWRDSPDEPVAAWPATRLVCNCNAVSRGALSAAIAGGCTTVESLQQATRAGTVCQSCRPLLAQLLDAPAQTAMTAAATLLLAGALLGVVLALGLSLSPPLPYWAAIPAGFLPDWLWRDNLPQQVTGYTALTATLLAATISVRRRWPRAAFGDFAWWQSAHAGIGCVVLILLALHTGMHFGSQLNFGLTTAFVGASITGSVAATATALRSSALRRLALRGHLLFLAPLLALLIFHIVAVYYFY